MNSNPRETFTRHERDASISSRVVVSRRRYNTSQKRTFFILDLRFHVVDRVRRLYLERDRLPGQRFHENLHIFIVVVVVVLLLLLCARA